MATTSLVDSLLKVFSPELYKVPCKLMWSVYSTCLEHSEVFFFYCIAGLLNGIVGDTKCQKGGY